MIDDGLFDRFPKPSVVLGQHVMVGPAGSVGGRTGVVTSAADSFQIRLFGRGAHGSMPQASIDPVVMAAATVLRLQTIVSRELAPTEAAVVTIGALQAGTKENVIPDEAIIKLNVRTFDEGVRKRVLAAIERIVNAEAAASGAPKPPEITPLDRYALVVERCRREPTRRRRLPRAFLRDARARDGTDVGERGLRLVRRGVARAVGILVRRRHRPRRVCEGEGGGQDQRDPEQSQSALRPGAPSDAANGRGGARGRRARMAVGERAGGIVRPRDD